MDKQIDGIVLCVYICIEDGWYGDRHRIILTDNDEGFRTKTEAKKYTAKLKKYANMWVKQNKNIVYTVKKDDIAVTEHNELQSYVYCGSGPSLFYKHHYINIQQLLSSINQ